MPSVRPMSFLMPPVNRMNWAIRPNHYPRGRTKQRTAFCKAKEQLLLHADSILSLLQQAKASVATATAVSRVYVYNQMKQYATRITVNDKKHNIYTTNCYL